MDYCILNFTYAGKSIKEKSLLKTDPAGFEAKTYYY